MRKLFTLLFLIAAFSVQAQHSVTLSTGKVVKGKITSITNEMVIIESYGNVYKCPYSQVTAYDNGDGIVMISGNSNNRIPSSKVNPSALTAGNELRTASGILSTGIVFTGVGVLAAVLGPALIATPKPILTYDAKSVKDYNTKIDAYNSTVKTVRYVGCGLVLLGTIIEMSSISHFRLAGELLNVSTNKDGIGLSLKL